MTSKDMTCKKNQRVLCLIIGTSSAPSINKLLALLAIQKSYYNLWHDSQCHKDAKNKESAPMQRINTQTMST